MECLYHAGLETSSTDFTLEGEEFRHVRALRLREGEMVLCSNGGGLVALCRLEQLGRLKCTFSVDSLRPAYNEDKYTHVLALGILQTRDRFEFALEKAVELGISGIIPLLSDHSQKVRLRHNRLEQKMLAAMKQSRRAVLPTVGETHNVNEFLENTCQQHIILCDVDGEQSLPKIDGPTALLVGPEGGFSEAERSAIKQDPRTICLNLGHRRLRAETAVVCALALLNAARD